jgi:hypothetical protein
MGDLEEFVIIQSGFFNDVTKHCDSDWKRIKVITTDFVTVIIPIPIPIPDH